MKKCTQHLSSEKEWRETQQAKANGAVPPWSQILSEFSLLLPNSGLTMQAGEKQLKKQ